MNQTNVQAHHFPFICFSLTVLCETIQSTWPITFPDIERRPAIWAHGSQKSRCHAINTQQEILRLYDIKPQRRPHTSNLNKTKMHNVNQIILNLSGIIHRRFISYIVLCCPMPEYYEWFMQLMEILVAVTDNSTLILGPHWEQMKHTK